MTEASAALGAAALHGEAPDNVVLDWKFGDEAAWAPRIKTGYEALVHSAINGKNSMPPQGGHETSDYEIGRAVVYMANKGGAKFEEPKAPAAAASAPAAAK